MIGKAYNHDSDSRTRETLPDVRSDAGADDLLPGDVEMIRCNHAIAVAAQNGVSITPQGWFDGRKFSETMTKLEYQRAYDRRQPKGLAAEKARSKYRQRRARIAELVAAAGTTRTQTRPNPKPDHGAETGEECVTVRTVATGEVWI